MPVDAEKVRADLRKIGERRQANDAERRSIANDTSIAIKQARKASLSMTEVARLIGLDRGAIYRTYG